MSRRFKVADMDEIVRSRGSSITILNNLSSETEEDREIINNLLMTNYDHTDVLSSVPHCQCGAVSGGYNLGKICKGCSTPVSRPVEGKIDATVWLKVPDGVDGFILPDAWFILTSHLSSTGYNLLEWLINPNSIPPTNASKVVLAKIEKFKSAGWQRGLNNFIRNLDFFMEILPTLKIKKSDEIIEWLKENRSVIFPKHLPMPDKSLLVLENTAVGYYSDKHTSGAIDAARTILSISKEGATHSIPYLERKTVSIIKNLSNYLWNSVISHLNKKRGWLRGQLFRSRSHFCMRGVITSIDSPHRYDEIWIPWAQGLELFKLHLVNKLCKLNYNISDAYALVESTGKVYVPLLDTLLKEIISESPEGQFPVIFQRNPTLVRASAQCVGISRVKTDVEDLTISMSPLIARGPNADYDGDEMNIPLLLDAYTQRQGALLKPHYGIQCLSNLGHFNHNPSLPEVTVSVISNFVNRD